ncbi:alpha/beta fold hydrolase [Hymenobacter terrestris]|uniref:Alpha/beta fold hydrolase n=1 Tax=Hymenobacter terrestris TaxID=2748310 RepID=A0ABX2Q7A1_9BACT|nr:alpha/beta fold hydrolase [Hymenobacter terrestris]NVO86145.1 alpha/beta fold hydrolase [Hymenobacter terrestris]
MRFWFLLLLLLPYAPLSFAQTTRLHGRVLDAATGRPVPFASVGVAGRPFGTVADSAGRFAFLLPDSVAAGARVLASGVGYATTAVPATAPPAAGATVRLQPVAVALAAVMVRPGKVRTRTTGRTGSSSFMMARLYTEPGAGQDERAKEQGSVLSLPPDCHLLTLRLHVAFNRFQAVTLRLNLYDVKQGRPTEPLLTQDIRFTVTQPRGWVEVDLEPYRLYIQNRREVVATIQWLRSEARLDSATGFALSAVPGPGHAILTRDKSHSRWQSTPGYLSLQLVLDEYPQKGRRMVPAAAPEPAAQLPDSLRYLQRVIALEEQQAAIAQRPAPDSVPYGRNPAAGHYLPVRGGRLYYERYGRGTPLLLLHGNGQSIAAFRHQLSELAQHYDVLALDTRAQGRSEDATTDTFTYELFAQDVAQLLDSLHLGPVDVLGWSDGGNTALALALARPAAVRRLVVMGANLFPAAIEPDYLALFREQLRQAQHHPDPQAPHRARLLQLLLQEPQMQFAQLAAVSVPVLVVAGEHDLVLKAHTRELARSLSRGEVLILPNATHYAPQEIPEAFNQAVLEFLARP